MLGLALAGCAAPRPPTPSPLGPTSSPSAQPTSAATPSVAPTPSASATGTPTASASPPPAGGFDPSAVQLAIEPLATDFGPLTLVTNAGDGSGLLYAVEQRGVIWTLDTEGNVAPTPFLDISERIKSGGEQGLLGLAFHPDYKSNGRFFVIYTNGRGDTVVSEFARGADGMGNPDSERELLGITQPFPNHNGGMLAFGADRYLYIGTGDGGSANDPMGNGQRLDTLLGKILRIDVDSGDPYAIPADNPFADGGGLPEIWDWGMRNPWRFAFDRLTGGLFIGDVGQDLREEVDVEPAGAGGRNYGWNTMEADRCFISSNCDRQGLTLPIVSYEHGGSCSVTGGYVYRGARYPALYGAYVFSDYCSGLLWALDADAALETGRARMFELGSSSLNPSSFGEDEAGELYLVNSAGGIYRIVARTP